MACSRRSARVDLVVAQPVEGVTAQFGRGLGQSVEPGGHGDPESGRVREAIAGDEGGGEHRLRVLLLGVVEEARRGPRRERGEGLLRAAVGRRRPPPSAPPPRRAGAGARPGWRGCRTAPPAGSRAAPLAGPMGAIELRRVRRDELRKKGRPPLRSVGRTTQREHRLRSRARMREEPHLHLPLGRHVAHAEEEGDVGHEEGIEDEVQPEQHVHASTRPSSRVPPMEVTRA